MESLRYALEVTEEIMIPILEAADTMEHCYVYYENYNFTALSLSDDERLGIKYTKEYREEARKRSYESMLQRIQIFSSLRDNLEIYEDVLREAERRKAYNIEMLRSYGGV